MSDRKAEIRARQLQYHKIIEQLERMQRKLATVLFFHGNIMDSYVGSISGDGFGTEHDLDGKIGELNDMAILTKEVLRLNLTEVEKVKDYYRVRMLLNETDRELDGIESKNT